MGSRGSCSHEGATTVRASVCRTLRRVPKPMLPPHPRHFHAWKCLRSTDQLFKCWCGSCHSAVIGTAVVPVLDTMQTKGSGCSGLSLTLCPSHCVPHTVSLLRITVSSANRLASGCKCDCRRPRDARTPMLQGAVEVPCKQQIELHNVAACVFRDGIEGSGLTQQGHRRPRSIPDACVATEALSGCRDALVSTFETSGAHF